MDEGKIFQISYKFFFFYLLWFLIKARKIFAWKPETNTCLWVARKKCIQWKSTSKNLKVKNLLA